MKKLPIIVLAVSLIIVMSSCGNKSHNGNFNNVATPDNYTKTSDTQKSDTSDTQKTDTSDVNTNTDELIQGFNDIENNDNLTEDKMLDETDIDYTLVD
jgi:hypothetical protein